MENARCILHDSKLSTHFWGYAVLTAAHIHNRLPSHSCNNTSPLEFWSGEVPRIDHLRVFGSVAWVHVPKEKRGKLDAKSIKCIFIGYEEDAGSNVYRVWDPARNKLRLSRDVLIDESVRAGENSSRAKEKETIDWEEGTTGRTVNVSESPSTDFDYLERITPPPESEDGSGMSDIQETIMLRPQLANTGDSGRFTENARRQELPVRRSERIRRKEDMFSSPVSFALMASIAEHEPQTLSDALKCPEKDEWRRVWESELWSLGENRTWVFETLPRDRTAIGCR